LPSVCCALHICAVEQTILRGSQHSDNIIRMVFVTRVTYLSSGKEAALGLPQQDVRLLTDSNNWNVNGTLNLRTVRQILRVLSQLASGNVLAEPSIRFLSWDIKNQISSTKFSISSLWQHGRRKSNVPATTADLKGESFPHKIFSGKFGQRILCTPKKLSVPTRMSAFVPSLLLKPWAVFLQSKLKLLQN